LRTVGDALCRHGLHLFRLALGRGVDPHRLVLMPGLHEHERLHLLRIAVGVQLGAGAAERNPDQDVGRPMSTSWFGRANSRSVSSMAAAAAPAETPASRRDSRMGRDMGSATFRKTTIIARNTAAAVGNASAFW
jgi:hypothetical protein